MQKQKAYNQIHQKFLMAICQNVFKITDVVASDTIFAPKKGFTKRTALSEYLKLDIVRYTQRLKVDDTDWYVCVNFPENIANEDVNAIKKYASLIYFITTAILLVFFYLFLVGALL